MEKNTKDGYFWEEACAKGREGCRSWCNKARWTGAGWRGILDQCLRNCGGGGASVADSKEMWDQTARAIYDRFVQ